MSYLAIISNLLSWILAILIILTVGLGVFIYFQVKTYIKIKRVAEIYESQPHFVYEGDVIDM